MQSSDSIVVIESEKLVSAVVLKSKAPAFYEVWMNNNYQVIPRDEDVNQPTYFISLVKPSKQVRLKVPGDSDFKIFLIHSGETPNVQARRSRTDESNQCVEPFISVPQSEWRQGLPEPNYNRSFHQVNHNIVHHSAGSNSDNDFTQVVRDIYIYHTEVNGWSDIGYNYLIAQDGTIFDGRDPADGSQDNVRGAHFCGANSGTLGVCLLGNYETASLSNATRNSLETLLAYELVIQENNPFETYNHPFGNLGTIVGHRDGCATLCPGENVYALLGEIRTSVDARIQDCLPDEESFAFEVDTTLIEVSASVTFTASGDYDQFYWILDGAIPRNSSGESIMASYSVPGFYDVTLIGENGLETDTLRVEDYIQVSYLDDQPRVFPNPISRDKKLKIDFIEQIQNVTLHDVNGKFVEVLWEERSINTSELRPGIYFLTIVTASKVYQEKVIVI